MFKKIKSMFTYCLAVVSAFMISSYASAQATLPTEASTALTNLTDYVDLILAALWPIVSALTIGFVLIKLFKRGANKV